MIKDISFQNYICACMGECVFWIPYQISNNNSHAIAGMCKNMIKNWKFWHMVIYDMKTAAYQYILLGW